MRYGFKFSLLFFCIAAGSCQQEAPKQAPQAKVVVKTEVIKPKTIPAIFDYVGFAQSSHAVEIRSRVEGYLDNIDYTEGEFVKKGDMLFELDKQPFEAALENAKGVLAQQEAILWNAKKTLERLEPLYEQKATSRRDLDDAIAQKLLAEASIQSAKAKVKEAELNLGYATIVSPVNGLAEESKYRQGALITPGVNSLLTTVSVIDPIWINFSVSESDLLKSEEAVKKKLLDLPEDLNFDVEAILSNGTSYPMMGKVSFSSPTIDQQTGTMSVRAVLPNPKGVIKPGQFMRTRILGAVYPNAILVPQHAVLHNATGMFVYVLGKDARVEPRFVTVGEWYGNDWIIVEGLHEGDEVITEGVNKVYPGSFVQVIDSEKKAVE